MFYFFIHLLIFEGFPNRVLVYPDRGGLQIMLMICTNKLCQGWCMRVSAAKEKCDMRVRNRADNLGPVYTKTM